MSKKNGSSASGSLERLKYEVAQEMGLNKKSKTQEKKKDIKK